MKISRSILLAGVSATVLGLSGCVSTMSDSAYSRSQARQEMTVRMGVIESIREVSLEGSKSGVGGLAGAAVGGVAGSSVGQGKGQIVGAVLGAVAGGLAGSALEEQGTKKNALELTVKLEGGKTIAVVQEGNIRDFRVGDAVRVLSGGGETRVAPK